MYKIVNMATQETHKEPTKSQAINKAMILHNRIYKATGQKIRFKIVSD